MDILLKRKVTIIRDFLIICISVRQLQVTQTSKLDKADILELTVSYVKLVHFEEAEVAMAARRRYKSGYLSCAREALKCVDKSLNVNQTMKANIENFLTERCDRVCNADNRDSQNNSSNPLQPVMEPITVEIPTASFQSASRQIQRVSNNFLHTHPTQTNNMLALADNNCSMVLNNNFGNGTKVKHMAADILKNPVNHASRCLKLVKDKSSGYDLNDNFGISTKVNSEQFTTDLLNNSGSDVSHALNLSAADSSFSGDVWRPW